MNFISSCLLWPQEWTILRTFAPVLQASRWSHAFVKTYSMLLMQPIVADGIYQISKGGLLNLEGLCLVTLHLKSSLGQTRLHRSCVSGNP